MKPCMMFACVVVVSLVEASPALAQNPETSWFAGVGVGWLHTGYRPYYTYYAGGIPDQFENEADGLEVEVSAGRRNRVSDRLSLVVRASAAFNSFTWSLSIPEEPAELEYSQPYRFAVGVAPELHFGRVSVSADVGGGLGRVRQVKTSPTSSIYDFDKMRPTVNVGGAVTVRASTAIDVFARVGHVRYAGHEFDTFTPSGTPVERVQDSPRATGFTIGVLRRF